MLGQDATFIATPLSGISELSVNTLKKLEKLKLRTCYDLLFNLPFRYEDRTYIGSANNLPEDNIPCYFLLTVASAPLIKPRVTEIKAYDHEHNNFKIVLFHTNKYLLKRFIPGTLFLAWGTCRMNNFGHIPKPVLNHPEFTFIDDLDHLELSTLLTPVYHLTSGVNQGMIRKITYLALRLLANYPLDEHLPTELNPYGMDLSTALLTCHNPPARPDHGAVPLEALPSFQRICYEELVAYKLCILELKARQHNKPALTITPNEKSHNKLLSTLPFEPTHAQQRVYQEIIGDCTKSKAMNRLVHGDVGSGKTLVAAMVIEQFASQGLQTAMLAPTELLAQQHQRKLSEIFEPLGLEVVLVTGNLKKKERDAICTKAQRGQAKIFVGTHALFQQALNYQNLALVIVDEQHRFGVDQREALLNKAPYDKAAHELLMTATPIPRSLQMALYADTDVSTIDELPKGRSPIKTSVISYENMDKLIERLGMQAHQGNQSYWVCPLVEENEKLDASAAKTRWNYIQQRLPDLKIGLLHAQMSEKEKNATMADFIKGEIHILVATTIVEVGVDVPNSTVMVIENADRLGLAQLHQLRGRVGRGSKESFCLLMYKQPSEPSANKQEEERRQRAIKRLEIMCRTTNGFEIANQDLQMRGAGEFFGTHQAGKENFRFADLNRDYDLITNANRSAEHIFKSGMMEQARDLILRWFPSVLNESNGQPSGAMQEVLAKLK